MLHARKGASGAKRWMSCPGSLRASEGRPNRTNIYALLGTAAHFLGATCLQENMMADDFLGRWIGIHEDGSEIFDPPDTGFTKFEIDLEMTDAVQVYLDLVRAEQNRLGRFAELSIERRFDLGWLRPGMFGTNDASLLAPWDELVVIDYKHGSGIAVEVSDEGDMPWDVKGNAQLLYYALGAAHEADWRFAEIKLIIVQPRCPHPDGAIRSWTCSVEELKAFEAQLAAASDAADDAFAPRIPGEWCKFCPAAPNCSELADRAFEIARVEFGKDLGAIQTLPATDQIDSQKLSRMLAALPMLDAFARAIEGEALFRMREGKDVPGYKLVAKRSRRIWANEENAQATLVMSGYALEDLLTDPVMKSPAAIEKMPKRPAGLKRKAILELTQQLTIKPPGGATIAPMSDPRAPLDPFLAAVQDFKQLPSGDDE